MASSLGPTTLFGEQPYHHSTSRAGTAGAVHSRSQRHAARASSVQSAAQNQAHATPTKNAGHTHCPSPDKFSDTVPGRRCDRRKAAELSRSGLPSGSPGGACTRPLRLGPCVPSRRKRPGSTFVMLRGRCRGWEGVRLGAGGWQGRAEGENGAGLALHDTSLIAATITARRTPSRHPAPSPCAGIRARLRRRHQRRHAAGCRFAVQVHHHAPQRLRI